MKSILGKLTLSIILFGSLNSFAQPADLTHPAHQNKSKTVVHSISSISLKTKPVVFIYDGVTLSDSSLKFLDAKTINSPKQNLGDVMNGLDQRGFDSTFEITTIDGINPGLKYIKEKTNYWIRKNPLAVFYLNGQVLLNDKEKLAKLTALEIDKIKAIKTLNQEEGEQLLGKVGENGVMIITAH